MTRKTYIGIPHRESVAGQPVVTVCDGQKSEPLPCFLLSPFGWAAEPLGHAEPTLLADLFEMSQSRMHLIGLGLAHLGQ